MKQLVSQHNAKGFSLTDVMIGLVVMSVGLVALANFQTNLVIGGTKTKARSEAINLAQEKIEEFRNNILESQFDGWTDTSGAYTTDPDGTITGTNATFTRSWRIDDGTGPTRKDITVNVAWTDHKEGAQNVQLSSMITWRDPEKSARLAEVGTDGTDPILDSPGNGGELGDTTTTSYSDADSPTGINDNNDTTYTRVNELLVRNTDDNGYVTVLTVDTYFVKITGKIYLDDASSPWTRNFGNLSVLISSAGYCVFPTTSGTDGNGNAYAEYACYVDSEWYGRVGVLGYDSRDTVCSTNARAYSVPLEDLGETLSTPSNAEVHYELPDQNFVITNINGVTDCTSYVGPAGVTLPAARLPSVDGGDTFITVIISGTLSTLGHGSERITSVSISGSGSCSNTNFDYSCTTDSFNSNVGWSGTVSITATETVCGDNPVSFNGITTNTTHNFVAIDGTCP